MFLNRSALKLIEVADRECIRQRFSSEMTPLEAKGAWAKLHFTPFLRARW